MTGPPSPTTRPSPSLSPTEAGAACHSSLPNLFIVGAPKSGTTALTHYLGSHPELFALPWELHRFGTDLVFRSRTGVPGRISWEDYAGSFAGREAKRYRVDHSVFYLYSKRAAEEIHRFDPSSRIIVMLRKPVEQMYSEHSEMLYQGEEDIAEFEAALEAEPERRQGRGIPAGCRHAFGLFYRDLARYAEQLERYLSVFGRHQVHVVIHDDLVADAAGTYGRVLDFLDVDRSHRPDLSVVNANKVVRSTTVRRLLQDAPSGVRRTGRLLVPSATARARLRRKAHSLNKSQRPRPPMDPGLRQRLVAEFEPEVRRVESLLGRQLPGWHEG